MTGNHIFKKFYFLDVTFQDLSLHCTFNRLDATAARIPINSFKRLYTLQGLLGLVEKLHF